jgi:hypothetical protein
MKKSIPDDPAARSRLHALQYQHIDGTFELTFGGALLCMAASFYLLAKIDLPNSFIANNLLPFVPLAVFVGAGYLMDALVRWFRMRFTYPRTGYIAYLKPQSGKRSTRLIIWIGVPALTGLLLIVLFLNRSMFQTGEQDYSLRLIPAFSGLLLTGLWIVIGWKTALPRFYLIAVVSLLFSVGLFLNGVGGSTGMLVLFAAMGSALCVTGAATLQQYLRSHPALPETADER